MSRKAPLIVIVLPAIAILFFLQCQHQRDPVRKWYSRIDSAVSPDRIQLYGKSLCNVPHRAGTIANQKAGDAILKFLSEAGFKTSTEEYTFDFPEPEESHLLLVQPEQKELNLYERKFPEDQWSNVAHDQLPFLAYSPDADIEAPLIYANSGSNEDYTYLKEQGISVAGTIALVRARGVCRSMKILAAEKQNVAGLLIYPELKDQGFLKPEFPYGPHLNPWTIQRGTLLKYFLHPGDPLDADAQAISTLPKIPALPISSDIASTLLSHIQGNEVPEAWKGWLPQKYRFGPGPGSVRLTYKGKNETRTIRNIFASIDGPDPHFIVAGNHYDAWVYGASDPSSGTSTMLETMRVLSDLVKHGWKPQRKIEFAFWDGEEYGMFGSTKWVKNNLENLKQAIAYVNVDSAFRARDLAAYVSPGLHSSFDQALEGLKEPDSGRYFSEIRPEFQNPGFSGDTAPFVRFAGLPVVDAGFGRTYSVYHSLYDDQLWIEKFGDPRAGYRSALARILARYLLRLSSDPFVPYDFSEFQSYAAKALNELTQSWPDRTEWDSATVSLYDEMERFNSVATNLKNKKSLPDEKKKRFNELLVQAMYSFYDQKTGKSVLMETSSKLGCAGEALPALSEAVASKEMGSLKQQIGVLTNKFIDARHFLEEADSLAKK